jgi:hypothetical protein
MRAVVGGKARCLRAKERCAPRLDLGYHRHGFHCHGGRLSRDAWAPLFRPWKQRRLESGEACPVTSPHVLGDGIGWVLGDGPLYPGMSVMDGTVPFQERRQKPTGWWIKTPWMTPSTLTGRYLVRGRRLDAPGVARFVVGSEDYGPSQLPRQILFVVDWRFEIDARVSTKWRRTVTSTLLVEPRGCYAFQVDGRRFTSTVVFEASSTG